MSFTPKEAMSERLKKKVGLGGYVKRKRDANEALPGQINIFKLPVYKPAKVEAVRPGADDHLKIRSVA